MRLRVAITVIILILYVGLFNVYIYNFLAWSPYFGKVFYNCLTLSVLVFAYYDRRLAFVNSYHRQSNYVIFLCIFINYGFILCTILEIFDPKKHPEYMFYSFDGGVLAVTITIFWNELKFKVFND